MAEVDFKRIQDLVWEILEELEPAQAQAEAVPMEEQDDLDSQELAKELKVEYTRVPRHAHEFPGAYRLGGARGEFRFPRSGINAWKTTNLVHAQRSKKVRRAS